MSYLETRSADLEAVITDLENLNSKCLEMRKIRDSQLEANQAFEDTNEEDEE